MNKKRCGGIFAAAFGLALITGAHAQTTPDPLAPGAGATPDAEAAQTAAKAAVKTDAPAKPHPKHAKPAAHERGGSLAVAVHNQRSVGMVELSVGPAGDADLKKVAGPLAFGRKTVVHLKRTKDCLYDIHAKFADDADTDQTGVDLCKDKSINRTD